MRLTLFFVAISACASAEEFPVIPYTDPTQLDCPWPLHSHYKQPWRAYIETKSGWDFLKGIGVNLQIPSGTEESAIRLLAETGFRSFRIEVGFGESNWDETRLTAEEKFQRRFLLCGKYSIRPTILIDAHHGAPCPLKTCRRRVVQDAAKGSQTLMLDDVADLELGHSGLSRLSDEWAAEILITHINQETREVTLSKPLPQELKAGDVTLTTLKYLPLYPVGTPEFDQTAAAWVAHTVRVCRLASAAGVRDFDVEIWNELTFGSHFLSINDYYDKASPKIPGQQPDSFKPGGRCWELARRTVDAIKAEFPGARCIWGFSSTTFYHTPIVKLPAMMDGQSYHPYGTGTRIFNGTPPSSDQPSFEGFDPRYEMRMPEGFMQTFIQTESLIRHLNPLERLTKKPSGTTRFRHYITEHGVLAEECGISDEPAAWKLKALCAMRSFCLWLNKGIDVLHYFDAYESDARSFGVLPANLRGLPVDAKFEEVATPPMRAIRNLTRTFRDSIFLERTHPLQIEVTGLDAPRKIFDGDETHPPLWDREVLAALPFQIDAEKHILAVYVMTRDATKSFPAARYRLRIMGSAGRKVECYDPYLDKMVPVELAEANSDAITVTLPVVDYPRLLILSR